MKLQIVAHPSSKKPRIEFDLLNTMHVYIREPALEGAANRALILVVSKYYKVPKSKVILVKGEKSKLKNFDILT
jgi:hypothetical protein